MIRRDYVTPYKSRECMSPQNEILRELTLQYEHNLGASG